MMRGLRAHPSLTPPSASHRHQTTMFVPETLAQGHTRGPQLCGHPHLTTVTKATTNSLTYSIQTIMNAGGTAVLYQDWDPQVTTMWPQV